jgi:hypothetical protein
MFGTLFAFVTQRISLLWFVPGSTPAEKTAIVAAGVAGTLFLANLILSCFLPEPKKEMLAD